MAYTLDKTDYKILERVAAEGPCFMKHPRHEMRACEMRLDGLMKSEMALYSLHAGTGNVEFRQKYALTKKGQDVLAIWSQK